MKRIYLTALACISTHWICAESKNVYQIIANQNSATLAWTDEDWPQEAFYEYLMRCMDYQQNPQAIKIRRIVLKLLGRVQPIEWDNSCYFDSQTWIDLNMFQGHNDGSSYLADIIDRTHTHIGRMQLYTLLARPLVDTAILESRQSIIKHLLADQDLFEKITHILQRIARNQNYVLSFWDNDQLYHTAQRHYFSIPVLKELSKKLNTYELPLQLKSLASHQHRSALFVTSFLATMILPFYGISQLTQCSLSKTFDDFSNGLMGAGGKLLSLSSFIDNNFIKGTLALFAAGYSCLAFKEEYLWMRDNAILDKCLQTKLIAVAEFIEDLQALQELLQASPDLKQHITQLDSIEQFLQERPTKNPVLAKLFGLLRTTTFKGEASIMAFHGRTLAAYELMYQVKNEFEKSMSVIGLLDAYHSIAHLYKQFEHAKVTFSFVEYAHAENPYIDIQEFWNPFITPELVVTNSFTIDQSLGNQNMIITGPNAGGKSTIIKAIALNIVLGQTLGLAPAARCVLSPFTQIATYLNITDDIASGNSLFKMQVLRAQELLDVVKTLSQQQFSFMVFDKMFSGTLAKEGEAAAYSVAQFLGNYQNAITIIATHFPLLTRLEKRTGLFKNYHVSVNLPDDGSIEYPYTLERGISKQHIAIDILRQEGFDSAVLNTAYQLLHKIK